MFEMLLMKYHIMKYFIKQLNCMQVLWNQRIIRILWPLLICYCSIMFILKLSPSPSTAEKRENKLFPVNTFILYPNIYVMSLIYDQIHFSQMN